MDSGSARSIALLVALVALGSAVLLVPPDPTLPTARAQGVPMNPEIRIARPAGAANTQVEVPITGQYTHFISGTTIIQSTDPSTVSVMDSVIEGAGQATAQLSLLEAGSVIISVSTISEGVNELSTHTYTVLPPDTAAPDIELYEADGSYLGNNSNIDDDTPTSPVTVNASEAILTGIVADNDPGSFPFTVTATYINGSGGGFTQAQTHEDNRFVLHIPLAPNDSTAVTLDTSDHSDNAEQDILVINTTQTGGTPSTNTLTLGGAAKQYPPCSCATCNVESADPTRRFTRMPDGLVVGAGVMHHSGEYWVVRDDLKVKGTGMDFAFTRTYKSQIRYDGPLGHGWDFNYNMRLKREFDGVGNETGVWLYPGSGRVDWYGLSTPPVYDSPSGVVDRLTKLPDGSYEKQEKDGDQVIFSSEGRLTRIQDRYGNRMLFNYSFDGKLVRITDSMNKDVTIGYNPEGRIGSITDFDGRSVLYEYDAFGNLEWTKSPPVPIMEEGWDITQPPVPVTRRALEQYTYTTGSADEDIKHNLEDIRNDVVIQKGDPSNIHTDYNPSTDQVIAQTLGEGSVEAHHFGFQYLADKTIFTEDGGVTGDPENPAQQYQKHYTYDQNYGIISIKEYTPTPPLWEGQEPFYETTYDRSCACNQICGITYPTGAFTTQAYDINQNMISKIKYDGGGFLGTVKEQGWTYTSFDQFCRLKTRTEARGYDPGANPLDYTTTYEYDNFGNPKTIIPPKVSVPPPTGTGAMVEHTIERRFVYDGDKKLSEKVVQVFPTPWPEVVIRWEEWTYYLTGHANEGRLESHTIYADPNDMVAPKPLSTYYVYDTQGRITLKTDPNGETYSQQFDNKGNLLMTQTPPVSTIRKPAETPIWYRIDYGYDGNSNRVVTMKQLIDDKNSVPQVQHPFALQIKSYNTSGLLKAVHVIVDDEPSHNLVTTYDYGVTSNDSYWIRAKERMNGDVNGPVLSQVVRIFTATGRKWKEEHWPQIGVNSTSLPQYTWYNPGGTISKIRDARRGLDTDFTYTPDGYVKTKEDPLGNRVEYQYIDGNTARETKFDASNKRVEQTRQLYDEWGRAYEETKLYINPDGSQDPSKSLKTTIIYDDLDRISRILTPQGPTDYKYDGADRTVEIQDALGNKLMMEYDNNGNVTRRDDIDVFTEPGAGGPVTRTILFDYDEINRLRETTVVDPAGNTTEKRAYDSLSNLTWVKNATENEDVREFDRASRLIATESFEGDADSGLSMCRTEYEYWESASKKRIKTMRAKDYWSGWNGPDHQDKVTSIEYDGVGRPTKVTFPFGNWKSYEYDDANSTVTISLPDGAVITETYDELNRLDTRETAAGYKEEFQWDSLGRLKDATTSSQGTFLSKVEYIYDGLGRVEEEIQWMDNGTGVLSYPVSVKSEYDIATGLRTKVHSDWQGPFNRTVTYQNDALGRISTLKVDNETDLTTFHYLGVEATAAIDFANGVRMDNLFDAQGRIYNRSYINPGTSELLVGLTYDFDDLGNPLKEVRGHDIEQGQTAPDGDFFTYDSISRLKIVKYDYDGEQSASPDWQDTFDYCPSGNRVSWLKQGPWGLYTNWYYHGVPATNRYIRVSSTEYGDVDPTYNANGDLTADGRSRLYQYGGGPPVHPALPTQVAHISGTFSNTARYMYDARGRRFYKNSSEVTLYDTFVRYIYDGDMVIGEIEYDRDEVTGQLINPTLAATYMNGRTIDERVRTDRPSAAQPVLYYLTDTLGSVAGLMDGSGAIREYYLYDAYGKVKAFEPGDGDLDMNNPNAEDKSHFDNPYLFVGRRLDAETGLYYLRARYYDPWLGRFIQRDPAGYMDSSNLYTYAMNNPVNNGDPMGLSSWWSKTWKRLQRSFRKLKFKIMQELARWSDGNFFQKVAFFLVKPFADTFIAVTETLIFMNVANAFSPLRHMAMGANLGVQVWQSAIMAVSWLLKLINNAQRWHPSNNSKSCVRRGLDAYESLPNAIDIPMKYPSGVRHWVGAGLVGQSKAARTYGFDIHYKHKPDESHMNSASIQRGSNYGALDLFAHEIFHVVQGRAYNGTQMIVNNGDNGSVETQAYAFDAWMVSTFADPTGPNVPPCPSP